MLPDCRHPRLRNLNSTVPVDVVRVKSYVDTLLNSTRVPVRVSVNKLNFVPERITLVLLACSDTAEVWTDMLSKLLFTIKEIGEDLYESGLYLDFFGKSNYLYPFTSSQ